MHLVYVDEVKYEPPVQPYYWLGGLGIPDRAIQSVDALYLGWLKLSSGLRFSTPIMSSTQSTSFTAKGLSKAETFSHESACT